MTIDEAIKEFEECAKADRREQNYWAAERDETSPFNNTECIQLAEDCETRAEYNEQLAEWLTELKEAKRLLKLAFPIINSSCRIDAITNPSTGKKELLKHYILDEALKLIGGSENG